MGEHSELIHVLTNKNIDMETAQQFIKAISNITWSQFNRNAESNGTLKSDDGFSLSYGTKFHERGSLPSVQIIAQVRYNETYLMTWGFTDDASQREFVTFLNNAKFQISEAGEREERRNFRVGHELFK